MGQQTKFALSGFIGNTHDALIVFEACRRGILPRAQGRLSEAERKAIKSGDIYVFNEEESQIKRWTDGKRWSPSRILNNFLIYREVKSDENDGQDGMDGETSQSHENKPDSEEVDELAPSFSAEPSTARRPSNTPSVTSPGVGSAESSQSPRTVDPKLRNITGGLELLPNRKEGGLIKKTISVAGLHMISYYTPEDVLANRLRQPGSMPEIANLDISHPFLMAQFFRHPPQVTFDADQMPHFAGITDDEPMVRRPHVPQRRKREQSGQPSTSAVEASLMPAPGQSTFQNISHDPPLLAPLPPRTSLSPIGPHHLNHMLPSPIHHTEQTVSSIAGQMSTDANPLMAPVRPSTGSRSSTGLSSQSMSDGSSPRLRPTPQHRHEPYRLPSGRNRYSSALDPAHSPIDENMQATFPYPKQASLPNPGMDYYRNNAQQGMSQSFQQASYSRSLEQSYPWPTSTGAASSGQEYQYTLAGSERASNTPWTTSSPLGLQDGSRPYYSAPSGMPDGQLPAGGPPNNLHSPHMSTSVPHFPSAQTSHGVYSHPTLYAGPNFYSRTPAQVDHNQQNASPWYGRIQEESFEGTQFQQQHGHSHPQQMVAPQAVQHLSGFLPQTGYSPLLPSSAAYANEMHGPEQSQEAESNQRCVKAEPSSPGKQGTYDSNSQNYVTAPPPPSYTHPNETFLEGAKAAPAANGKEDIKPVFHYQYPASGMYDPSQMEDPRDA